MVDPVEPEPEIGEGMKVAGYLKALGIKYGDDTEKNRGKIQKSKNSFQVF